MQIVEAIVKDGMLYLLVNGGGRLLAFKTAIREFEITFDSPYSYRRPGRPTGRIDLAVFDFQAMEGGHWYDEEKDKPQIETVYKLPKPS